MAVIKVYSDKNFRRNNFSYKEVELVKDYEATDKAAHVAWHGTIQLFRDGQNNYYVEYHSGNSNYEPWAIKVDEKVKNYTLEQVQNIIY